MASLIVSSKWLTDRYEDYSIGRTIDRAMKYSFDVVSVGIEDIGGVIPGMVLPFARRPVFDATCCKGSRVETGNAFAVGSLESEVYLGVAS